MTFGISWSMSIAMASVEDGGLQFKIVQGSDKVNVSQNSSGNMSWSPPPQQIAETFKNRVQGGMESALSGVGNYLLYGLADQQRLFLPGKGSYLMKNPIFNSRGDLLVDLHFNGYSVHFLDQIICVTDHRQCRSSKAEETSPALCLIFGYRRRSLNRVTGPMRVCSSFCRSLSSHSFIFLLGKMDIIVLQFQSLQNPASNLVD
ncbi:unnamed protein product [Aspergillus oryzae]|nr:unnamed protein product [Aspergillus oryzae]